MEKLNEYIRNNKITAVNVLLAGGVNEPDTYAIETLDGDTVEVWEINGEIVSK